MSQHPKKKMRTIAVIQAEKHKMYGFTSLETLSGWHGKIDKNKNLNFECKKESQCIGVTNVVEKI
ncbi:hypothetical protein [Aliivibrio wodanis]|uniref:hypothetical protein n=1 Tax=Aliivibrio wodanis TaxID=80852 RepID=UPI00406CDD28